MIWGAAIFSLATGPGGWAHAAVYVAVAVLVLVLVPWLVGDRIGLHPVAVIFADLVGFTTLSERLEDDDLAELVSRFQSVAYELVAKSGGRIVKTLGDEVMVVKDTRDHVIT